MKKEVREAPRPEEPEPETPGSKDCAPSYPHYKSMMAFKKELTMSEDPSDIYPSFVPIAKWKKHLEQKIKEWNEWMVPRDPARIPRILDLIGKIWERCPDMRFFQLLRAIFKHDGNHSMFYQEDDKTEDILKKRLPPEQRLSNAEKEGMKAKSVFYVEPHRDYRTFGRKQKR